MRTFLTRLALLGAGLAVAGLLFAWSGLFNVAASTGHWAITDWFLHWVMRNSVATHAAGIEPPPLDDLALVERGAGHFATGCAPCHGAPGVPQPPVVHRMTPPPPRLEPKIAEWSPSELFWIVRHGVKFSGMPAWASPHRPDEVWSVVAFLVRLPGLDAAGYRRLAFGEPAREAPAPSGLAGLDGTFATALDDCARCHDRDGTGRPGGAFPRLTGLSEDYLLATLRAFAAGRRASGIMQPAAGALRDQELQALARHFAAVSVKPPPDARPADPEALRRGEAIARHGVPGQGVPACRSCHGPGGPPRNPYYPSLAGQPETYLAAQLELWRQGVRGGTAYAHLMATIAGRMTPDQVADTALYYARLPAASAPP